MTDAVRKVVNQFFELDDRDQQQAMSLVLHKYWHGTKDEQPDVPVSDEQVRDLVNSLIHDAIATVGPGQEPIIEATAADHRRYGNPNDNYVMRVVEDVQQQFHDMFIDTTWPQCPMHSNHPLWFGRGHWVCVQPVVRIKLGELPPRRSDDPMTR